VAKQLKTLIRTELQNRFKGVDGGVVVSFAGLNSEQTYDLRKKLHAKGVKFHIVKNSLIKRAFIDMGYDAKKLDTLFVGAVGVVYAKDKATGAVGAAKALRDWKTASKDKLIIVKGGFLEGTVIDAPGMKLLADMPSRTQLLAMVAGALQAPIAAFAGTLKETNAKFAYALEAVRAKKEKEGGK
jgi:large subunit ribosomal protein L10